MKKVIFILLTGLIILTSCSDKMIGVISTTEPEIDRNSREIINVDNYKIVDQNNLEIVLKRNEEVKYETTYNEIQEWREGVDGVYIIGVFLLSIVPVGTLAYPDKSELKPGNWVLSIGSAIGAIYFLYKAFTPDKYNKTNILYGDPIYKYEWDKASYDEFNIAINGNHKKYNSNSNGIVTINPFDFQFPVLTEHKDFSATISKNGFSKIGTIKINSSWWMNEYGVINSNPVELMGNLNSYPIKLYGMLGEGSTVLNKKEGFYLLNLKNSDAWIKPKYLNIFYYSSPNKLGSFKALKSINYIKSKKVIIENQRKELEKEINE